MGADIFLKTLDGRKVDHYHENYGGENVFSVINGTLALDDKSGWYWWSASEHYTDDKGEMSSEKAREMYYKLLGDFCEVIAIKTWRTSTGTELLPEDKEYYSRKMVQLLKMLALAESGNYRLTWSV